MILLLFTTIVILAIGIAGIAIKILLKKNGKFAGTCSSNNPIFSKENGACGICGAKPEEKCKA